ncbi:quinol:cytochrome C oxidoreductase [Candidatus Marinamargulisbacteria bacterium SCGC AAA071-K20]|nr:quinol:cytochrome C oxidoreductase [Candidatus Marinamargulisbacteria bacterium SCGC AAA071-K20]
MQKKTLKPEELKLTGYFADKLPKLLMGIGAVCLAVAFFFGLKDTHHFYYSYLVSFIFYTTISLGALFFVLIQHLTRAEWSVVVRRVAEHFMSNIMLMALFFIPILFGLHDLYHWTHHIDPGSDPILEGKVPYLNVGFFVLRAVVFFLLWIWLSRKFYNGSVEQDSSGDEKISLKLRRASTYGILIFALSQTFAFVDWIMSLTPHWYSTIFGIYLFAGSVVVSLSMFSIVLILFRKSGILKNIVSLEHFHDLGKLIYGFNLFWAYIAFSQYFLIWYANIPEETIWYLAHFEGSWNSVAICLAIGHFAIPFVLFMSRHCKRNLNFHLGMAIWIVSMHFLDLYWLIMPNLSKSGIHFSMVDVLCFFGMGGVYFSVFFKRVASVSLVPKKDPFIEKSLHFENM